MAADWYYRKNGHQLGPLEAADLKRLADTGVVAPDDMVWRQGAKQWTRASSVKGLFASPSNDVVVSTPQSPTSASKSGRAASADLSEDDWWKRTSTPDDQETESLPSRYSDDGIAYAPPERSRPATKRKDFPALRVTAGMVRLFALLALLVAGLSGIVAVQKGIIQDYVLMGAAIGFLVAFIMISLLYFAAAEGISLALYLTTLLEDIRDK